MKKLETIDLKEIRIRDFFWDRYVRLVRDVIIPYQWDAMNDRIPDAEPSHCLENFKLASQSLLADAAQFKAGKSLLTQLLTEGTRSSRTGIWTLILSSKSPKDAGRTSARDMSCIRRGI